MDDRVRRAYQLHSAPWWKALTDHRRTLSEAERKLRDAENEIEKIGRDFARDFAKGLAVSAALAPLGPVAATVWSVFGITRSLHALVTKPPEQDVHKIVSSTLVVSKTLAIFQTDLGAACGDVNQVAGYIFTAIKVGQAWKAKNDVRGHRDRTSQLLVEVTRVIDKNGVGVRLDVSG
jgi:hypothetical protein